MKFLFDHDLPDELGNFLTQLGHEVHRLREELPTDAPDTDVLVHAARQGCVLLTCNRDDFLKLASAQTRAGMIILIRHRSRAADRAALLRLLQRAGPEGLVGNINFA